VPDQDFLSGIDAEELEKLDRWKYLPMLSKSYRYMPEAKWYIYLESSTYISIPNVLLFLSKLSSSEGHFLGNRLFDNKMPFAAAGSGFILSNAALASFQSVYSEEKGRSSLEKVVAERNAGDIAISMALMKSGSIKSVTQLWPTLQSQNYQSQSC